MPGHPCTRVLVSTALLALASPLLGGTLVDTGPAPGTPGPALSPQAWVGAEITLPADAIITGIQIWTFGPVASPDRNPTGSFTTALYASDGVSFTPGALLFSAKASGPGEDIFGWVGTSGLSWSVPAGTYWITFEVRAGEGDDYVGGAGSGPPNPLARNIFRAFPDFGGVWTQSTLLQAGWRVLGPAPDRDPGVIPEPSTWAMLIAGFGLVGGALRARRRTARA